MTVMVDDYMFDDFMKVLKKQRNILINEPVKAFICDGYVSIPEFEKLLENMGVEPEEFKEIFE